jgi:adenylate cyclase
MKREDLAVLQAAGLYDPADPKAAERLELLEWLLSRDLTPAEIVEGVRSGSPLTGLIGDLHVRVRGERISLDELAARAGMTRERVEQIRLAVGLAPAAADRQFSADDVPVFLAFDGASKIFGEEAVLEYMRVMGSSVARIADATVALFLTNVEGPIVDRGGTELELARANLDVIGRFETLPPLIGSLLRAHMDIAIRRMRSARPLRTMELFNMSIGFIDLVGFTSLSRTLSAKELADVVGEFEGRAHDVVTVAGGRLVKLIGDEVMFAALDAGAACDVALTLVESFAGDALITPRGGVATGGLLMRGGDYYGPVVNLASRIAELAVPQEVLVTQELVTRAGTERFQFEPAGKRLLKGFDEPVPLFAAQRKKAG